MRGASTPVLADISEKEVAKDRLEEAIYYHSYKEMKMEISELEKLEYIKNDNFTELPEYMKEKSLEKARMAFRIRSKMVQNIKMNFKGSYKNNLCCDKCGDEELETQCHVMVCQGWEDVRAGLDMTRMEDMVIFISRLLEEKGGK